MLLFFRSSINQGICVTNDNAYNTGEPTLDDILMDPIVRLVMHYDGVALEQLLPLLKIENEPEQKLSAAA